MVNAVGLVWLLEREEELARYTVIDLRRPTSGGLGEDVGWIARCFGFMESRDVALTASRIFGALVYAAVEGGGLTSDELSERVGVTRGGVVHHLNKMMSCGLVIFHGGRYKLRSRSLWRTVEEIRLDLNRVFEKIGEISKSVDQNLNLTHRET